MKVEIAKVCCLCYGSNRALLTVLDATKNQKNIVLYKELLHNKITIQKLKELGVEQKDDLNNFTKDDCVIIRAHGEPKSTFEYLDKNGIEYIDCTCPNVKAINTLVNIKSNEGFKVILIGKYGKISHVIHPEVYGTSGWCDKPLFVEDLIDAENIDTSFKKYFLAVQTTFSYELADKIIERLKTKFEKLGKEFEYKNTTCNAQRKINESSVALAKNVGTMFVVGGKNSSNTKELYNNVSKYTKAYFVESFDEIKEIINNLNLSKNDVIGLAGGASTNMEELEKIKKYLESI